MQQGFTLAELAGRLDSDNKLKKDLLVDTRRTELVPIDNTVTLQHHDPEVEDANFGGELNMVAHDQVAEYLKIPRAYYRRMLSEKPELLVRNANEWLQTIPQEQRMLRTLRGKGRAWLSNGYQRIDNYDVAEVALNALAKRGIDLKTSVISSQITDTRLYVEIVFENLEYTMRNSPKKVGDIVKGGMLLRNSEVGFGHFDISEFDYRLVCTNGMVGQSVFKRRHTGARVLTNEALWSESTKKLMDRTTMSQIGDMIADVAGPERFQRRMERVDALNGLEMKGDPNKVVKALSKVLGPTVGLTETEEGSILQSLIGQGDGGSAFGILQALTAQANENPDYDRAVELQEAGGRLLSLNKTEWTRILDHA